MREGLKNVGLIGGDLTGRTPKTLAGISRGQITFLNIFKRGLSLVRIWKEFQSDCEWSKEGSD